MSKTKVITGRGVITRFATSIEEYYQKYNSFLDGTFSFHENYLNKNIKLKDKEVLEDLPRIGVTLKTLLLATEQAVKESNLIINYTNAERVGVIVCTQDGVMESQIRYLNTLHNSSMLFQHTANNLLSGVLAIKYGIRGYSTVICNSTASGWDAFLLANYLIDKNVLETVIVACCDGTSQYHMEDRDSVITNQSCVLLIEAEDMAKRRQQVSLGRLNINGKCTHESSENGLILWKGIDNKSYSIELKSSTLQNERVLDLTSFIGNNNCSSISQCVLIALQEKRGKCVSINIDKKNNEMEMMNIN